MRYISFLAAVLLPLLLLAQAPQAFDFQGVARDVSGNVISSQAISLRISILAGSLGGDVAYQETHSVTTSPFGLFTIQVGNGTPTQSTFPSIGWGASAHFIQVEMDASGGSGFQDMGTTQLLSVPYALHARAVDCFSVSLLGDTLKQGNGCFVIIPGISIANGGCLDLDGDGVYDNPGCSDPIDCDDNNATVYPGAPELCSDGLDNDCDGVIDNNPDVLAHLTWYQDADGDGFGDAAVSQLACAQPAAYVDNDEDCDDADPSRFPGQGCSLVCSQTEQAWIDQNQEFYLDQVFLAWANCFLEAPNCVEEYLIEAQLSGQIPISLTCHSCAITYVECIQSSCLIACATNPLSIGCQDCIATNCRAAFLTCAGLIDADGDGWSSGSDCDDSDPTIFPGAPEPCDGIDNNCDGQVDEGVIMTWYLDQDGDGYGAGTGTAACDAPGPDYTDNDFDCDDNDPNVFPGQGCAGFECGFFYGTQQGTCGQGTFCDNGVCVPCQDLDGDGFFDCDGDCDDNNPDIFPGATENCTNGIDDNCDGQVDEECPCVEGTVEVCGSNSGACQQGTRTCLPGGVWGNCIGEVVPTDEICNGIDDDCDGEVDEDFVWYVDADADGFGDDATAAPVCAPQPGMVEQGGDCDDTDPNIYPGAPEGCNGVDSNCDGLLNNLSGSEVYSPNWTAQASTGETVDLFGLLAQGKAVVLDLFAAWCAPSQQMLTSNFLQDWNAHMGPSGTDQIRIVAAAVDQNAGTLTPFINAAQWPVIVQDAEALGVLYNSIGMFNSAVPTVLMICPDRKVTMLYPQPDVLPYSGTFVYDAVASSALIDATCACNLTPCSSNIGCMDPSACNFDPAATCPGPCVAAIEYYLDNDGDGFGSVTLGASCSQPNNSSINGGDCDDNDPDIVPFSSEICGNGIDENCDGQVDEDCPCVPGTIELCTGSEIGACHPGTRTCQFDGTWGFCEGEIGPIPEFCDGIDNDCNGLVDDDPLDGQTWFRDADGDGFGTSTTTTTACTQPSGFVANSSDCDDNNASISPGAPEACNTIDDDCDGLVDEGFNLATDTQNCGACGIVCPPGTSCVNGQCVE